MNQSKDLIHANKIGEYLQKIIEKEDISNDGLVQIFELVSELTGAMSITECAKINNKSYNGIKKTHKIKEIQGFKVVFNK